MKTRIFTVILCAVMLFSTIFTLSACKKVVQNDYQQYKAYIFFPNGKMLVYGDVEYIIVSSDGLWTVTIDGHKYKTHISNIVFDIVE